MNTFISHQKEPTFTFFQEQCPYNGINVCRASLSSMLIDEYQKERWCGTDNYDSCALFLSKLLRRS